MNTLAPLGATPQAGQVGLRTRLVNEDESGGIPSELSPTPRSARPRDVRAVLFGGAESFFYVSPIFPRTTWMACSEQSSSSAWRSSLRVRSGFRPSRARIRR